MTAFASFASANALAPAASRVILWAAQRFSEIQPIRMTDASTLDALFSAATAARSWAYAPYSNFAVGAALLADGGAIHSGCNVENAAYPAGSCAEAGAISAMAAAGGRRIAAILVVGGGEALCTPCGACRQRIREFAAPDTEIVVAGPEGVRRRFTLAELLPESFGPENLAKPGA